jgi:hypothetical protein
VKAYVYDESRAKNEMTVLLNKNPPNWKVLQVFNWV